MRHQCGKSVNLKIALVVLLFALPQGFAAGDVIDSAANGFTVKVSANIHAAPADVFSRILKAGDWWDPAHSYSGDPHSLSIEGRAGGCFCETLPGGGSVQHMQVILVMPGKMLRLSGALGPLQQLAATGTLTFILAPASDGTKLDVTYAVGGYMPQGMSALAAPVNEVISEQISRLKNVIETGSPTAKQGEAKPQ